MDSSTVPKSEIEVLSQESSDEFGFYRIRAGQIVRYVTIAASVFGDDTMCRPNLLIPQLPGFLDSKWTRAVDPQAGRLLSIRNLPCTDDLASEDR